MLRVRPTLPASVSMIGQHQKTSDCQGDKLRFHNVLQLDRTLLIEQHSSLCIELRPAMRGLKAQVHAARAMSVSGRPVFHGLSFAKLNGTPPANISRRWHVERSTISASSFPLPSILRKSAAACAVALSSRNERRWPSRN